ncbi:DUF3710 domain-containing protein [Alloscardovia theropitheci]|uniref:DUF3710 domain-containing protein n=1 Tax=Alloscardovia theropitheci TaxID=2496842 RepID=A0A4V2MU15_9BIFI|nr:DUF3710 domain-containing protein [Alloscardovia theropitheci]TCD54649.1 DUF3710 domain-containing protein [Alloscardovia theropitheci]
MRFFGFGKKKDAEVDDEVIEDAVAEETADEADETVEPHGPWDINDDNAPDYDEYLNMGALYLPFLFGIELRLKATNPEGNIISATITYEKSSLEMEVFAAPKSSGIWDEIRQELLDNRMKAQEVNGEFGKEILLPVQVQGREVTSRIVGIDGPRWMVRAIFTGPAATEEDSEEKKALDKFLSDVVVNRGEEPLAPRDRVFLSRPLTPSQMREMEKAAQEAEEVDEDHSELILPDDPNGYGQQSQVQHTLRRGPLFSEMR